ncbi:MAG: L,D-transpeptidase family protein [Verrucomicrobia bacterium]|nr:L,D-transpeptidase family protein [Verrucomicrobiota bacterium]MCH8525635.1 L,D-transpeptidase family protein [Kiritimatiellia bacterium]
MKRLLLLFWVCVGLSGHGDVRPLMERAERARERGRLEEARETLFRAMRFAEEPEALAEVRSRLGEINLELLHSRHPQAESAWVEIRSGDTLGKIAAREGTTVELLRTSNQIRGDSIRLGQRLKVLREPFLIRVNKENNELVLYLGGRFFKAYQVSTGAGANTPEGEFRITDRIVHPDWWHPETRRRIPYGDPDHRIGTHWLGWNVRGFGIHGTDEPERLGEPVSLGCVRMHNDDVKELHDLVPSGTRVIVE